MPHGVSGVPGAPVVEPAMEELVLGTAPAMVAHPAVGATSKLNSATPIAASVITLFVFQTQ